MRERSIRHLRRALLLATGVAAACLLFGGDAGAQTFGSRNLSRGSSGSDVREVQIRVAGWYTNCAGVSCFVHFHLDGVFGTKTERAVKNFQKAYGAKVDGIVGPETFGKLKALESADASTKHFSWSEFTEKSQSCSTGNRGTFNGGRVGSSTVKENVRRLMYRMEAVRHRHDGKAPVYVTSGFRSTAYQDCLRTQTKGAARVSQHSYGTAMDGLMSNINLGRMRGLAKTSELHGIHCYASSKHNHLDIRLDNGTDNGGGRFTWPRTDSSGRDLDYDGKICTGGHKSPPSTGTQSPAVGLPLPDPWGLAEDPTAPTDAEGQAMKDASEEVWMLDDHDNVRELVNAVCECVPEIHDANG